MKSIKMPQSDRIREMRKFGAQLIVEWRREAYLHGHPPRPTLAEKMLALQQAEEDEVEIAVFPYPGESIRKCQECSWPARSDMTLCFACYTMQRNGAILESVRDRVRVRKTVQELEILAALHETEAMRHAALCDSLRRHLADRAGDPERSATPGTTTWICHLHGAIVVTTTFARCPECRGKMEKIA